MTALQWRILDHYLQAAPFFEQARDLATPFYQAHYSAAIGDCYAASGDKARAIEAYQAAYDLATTAGDNQLVNKVAPVLRDLKK